MRHNLRLVTVNQNHVCFWNIFYVHVHVLWPNDQKLSHAAGDFRKSETRSEN
jgi:hypothetical protein